MAYRLDIKRILSMNFFHDLPKIMLGCALAEGTAIFGFVVALLMVIMK